jgi:hypothetical protein
MSTENKKKRERHITSDGIAIYPRLGTPDFKYKKENGEYSIKLRVPEEKAAATVQLITEATEKSYKLECVKQEKAKLKRSVNIPFKAELDDQEKPTGNVIFSFKLPGKVKSRKTGEVFELKPQIFDKFGKPMTEEIWGGSTVKVAFEMRPYYTEGLGHGMTLQLAAVQVLKLVSRGQGTADQYGFEVEKEEAPEIDGDDEVEGTGDAKAKGDF